MNAKHSFDLSGHSRELEQSAMILSYDGCGSSTLKWDMGQWPVKFNGTEVGGRVVMPC